MKLAKMLASYKDDAIFGYSGAVRGYLNMTFQTSCYEGSKMSRIQQLSVKRGKRYAIMLNKSKVNRSWNMYEFDGATIYDNKTKGYTTLKKSNQEFKTFTGLSDST